MHRTPLAPITAENFSAVFMMTVSSELAGGDKPDCPVVIAAGITAENVRKCDCPNALRVYAIQSDSGHQCGENGRCPVRTYLHSH